ncbi:MAG: efflux RND transporter periplasmic adaptor subunit, partial [Planctomycetes bacterium]|nr:efflux RND transporter periplasmic adaptor subunit [Planctomycetota bacterium]
MPPQPYRSLPRQAPGRQGTASFQRKGRGGSGCPGSPGRSGTGRGRFSRQPAEETLISLCDSGNANGALEGILAHRSLIAGTVIEKHIVPGERVEPDKEVMTVANLSQVWAWVDLRENDLAVVEAALVLGPVSSRISVAAYPGEIFLGTLNLVGAIMDEARRTVRARVVLENSSRRLRPGMFCHAILELGADDKKGLTVPRSSVLRDEGSSFVFRHLTGEYFIRVPVKTGSETRDAIEILEGLAEGETVVAEGSFLL